MTDFQNIKFEKKNQIAYITIDRPKVLNALNMATMQELKDAFASVKDDAEVRVVILTGAGEKAFVAGADISESRSKRLCQPRNTRIADKRSSMPLRILASR